MCALCAIKIVRGSRTGGCGGGNTERCLKWGGGVIKESLMKQFKRRVGKGRLFLEGGDLEGVTTSALSAIKV